MANEGLTYPHRPAGSLIMPRWLVEAAFVGFLLLVFVGLTPFEVREPGTFGVGQASGGGDVMRQVFYLIAFAMLAVAALQRRSLDAFAVVPVSMLLLLAWCFASASWADVPGVVVRRAGLEAILVASVMLGVDSLGARRSLELLRYVLVGVLIVNWLSIPLVPQAVHLPGEADPGLVGDWRGLYFHKNIAGAVSAMTAMILLYFAIERRSWRDFALFVAAIGFTVMSQSKSSLGFLPMAIALGAIYRWAWKRDLDRVIVATGAVLATIVIATFVAGHATQISRTLENPAEFTGRSAIWQAELGYIADHPLLGAGYGTFADTGEKSPLANYVDNAWVERVSHGHNGYLQLLVTTGGIGFVLAMIALIVLPLLNYWRRYPDEDLALKALLFTLFAFIVLHNLLESDYLESDGPTWVMLLLSMAMLRGLSPAEPRLTGRGAWQMS